MQLPTHLLLTNDELAELVGSSRVCAQITWLQKNGWRYVLSRTGHPRVSRDFFLDAMGRQDAFRASRSEPNWTRTSP